jgi:apolipoprotein N-acyltransferase
MAMSKSVQTLRWLAVLPGALLCVVIVMFPIHWAVGLIQLLGKSNDDSFISIGGKLPLAAIPPEMIERLGYAFFTPFVMIISGAYIAPKFKFQTGIALAVLWGIGFGASMVYVISQNQYSGRDWLVLAITCVLGVAGVCSGLFRVYKKGEGGLNIEN